MPPTSPQSPGTKRKLRRGFGEAFNAALVNSVSDDLAVLDPEAAVRYAFIGKWFEKAAEDLDGIRINGRKVMSWTESMPEEVGEWTLQPFKVLIQYYALKAKPLLKMYKRIDVQTLESFIYRLYSAHNFFRNIRGSPDMKEKLQNVKKERAVKFNLRTSNFTRASLTADSVFALVRQCPKLSIPARLALSIVILLAITCSSGYRAGSLLRNISKRAYTQAKSGLRYSSITAWAVPTKGVGPNQLILWISPRSFKSHLGDGSSACLTDNGKLGVSASHLIMLAAELDGVLGDPTLKDVLDPKFLGTSAEPRRILFRPDIADQHVIISAAGKRSLETRHMAHHLAALSRSLGFELDVRTHDFRHLVAASVLQHYDQEIAGSILQHRWNSNVTHRYFGHSLPYFASLALYGQQVDSAMAFSVSRRTATPSDDTPRALNTKELDAVFTDPALIKLRAAQDALLTQVAKEYGVVSSAPQSLQAQVKQLGGLWWHKLVHLLEVKFREARAEWFRRKRQRVSDADKDSDASSPPKEPTSPPEEAEIPISQVQEVLQGLALPQTGLIKDDKERTDLHNGIAGYANLSLVDNVDRHRLSALFDGPVTRNNVIEALDLLREMIEGEQNRGSKHWAAAKKGRREKQPGGSRKTRGGKGKQKAAEKEDEEEDTDEDEDDEEYLREETPLRDETQEADNDMPEEDSADEDEEAQAFWAV